MNIGIDIDGTYNKYPEFFEFLINVLDEYNHGVYIITGLGHDSAIEKLRQICIQLNGDDYYFDKGWSSRFELVDTSLYNREERLLIGKVQSNEEIVGRFKQRMCKELNIDIMFDDMASVHRQFGDTPIFEVK
jgi:hypothetical protein